MKNTIRSVCVRRGLVVKTRIRVGPTEELYGNYNKRPPSSPKG